MICEMVNKMWKLNQFVITGSTRHSPVASSVSIVDVIDAFLCTLFYVCVLSWWIIPGRYLLDKSGLSNEKFFCKKR